jgi:hypothetical protein
MLAKTLDEENGQIISTERLKKRSVPPRHGDSQTGCFFFLLLAASRDFQEAAQLPKDKLVSSLQPAVSEAQAKFVALALSQVCAGEATS